MLHAKGKPAPRGGDPQGSEDDEWCRPSGRLPKRGGRRCGERCANLDGETKLAHRLPPPLTQRPSTSRMKVRSSVNEVKCVASPLRRCSTRPLTSAAVGSRSAASCTRNARAVGNDG